MEEQEKSPSLVSVIIAVYNDSANILKAIRSVLSQTYPHWELLIVNDASTDQTREIVLEFINSPEIAPQYPRIRFIENERNQGTYVSFNQALRLVQGDYVCVLGSDDVFTPDKLQHQVAYLDANPEAVGVRHRFTRNNILYEGSDNEASIMYRTKLIEEMGYYDNVRISGDSEFIYRIYRRYGAIPTLQRVLYHAIKREKSLTTTERTKIGSPLRLAYVNAYTQWHQKTAPEKLYMPFSPEERPFTAPDEILP